MKKTLYISIALLAGGMLTACQDDTENFDNQVFDSTANTVSSILLDGSTQEMSRTLQASIAQPEEYDVTITYAADPSGVDAYNSIYSASAVMLPDAFYEIPDPVATIAAGSVTSTEVTINFKNLDSQDLDRNTVYVLPVSVMESNLPVLTSARTNYFVIRGASLINVAANIAENNLSLASYSTATELNGLQQLTAEMYIYIDELGGSDSNIQTLLGIEGSFLFRISDSGLPNNQIQLAASPNVTDASWTVDAQRWTFLTMTYDGSTGDVQVYINGDLKGGTKASSNSMTVNWGSSSFYIGKSWNDNRWLNGNVCEVRVWNRVLTQDEIRATNHFYTVDPESEGLVAYWKFDEGEGNTVHDYANGYDLNAASDLTWVAVELPE